MTSEKCYIPWIVFFFLTSIGLLAGVLYLINQKKVADKQGATAAADLDTCLTKHCTLTASMLIDAIDTSVNPCENFYEFSCGNFIKTNPVPVDQNSISSHSTFNKNFELQLKNLMEGMGSLKGPNVLYRMQEAYHVCINTTFQRETEFMAFKNFTQKTLDWPLSSKWNWRPKHASLTEYMAMYEENGLPNPFIRIMVRKNDENTTTPYKIAILDQWSHSFLVTPSVDPSPQEERIMNLSMKFFRDVVHLLGNHDDKVIDNDIKEIRKVLDFVQELNKKRHEENENNKENRTEMFANDTESNGYQTITFRQLTELTGGKVNWFHVVNKRFRKKYTFTEDDEVIILGIEMFETIKLIANKFSLRVLINIMGWEAMHLTGVLREVSSVQELFEKLQTDEIELDDDKDHEDIQTIKLPRWKQCLQTFHRMFLWPVTRMFLEAYIDKTEKQSADEMIHWILKAYKKTIRESDWLDEETRQNAIIKADAIKRFVGYPDFIFEDKVLDKIYEKALPEVRSTHFQNVFEMISNAEYQAILDLDDPRPKDEWDIDPLVVNAYYDPFGNSIWFPYGILQLPFFQNNRLAAMNFGMIGAVIGHEIGHAFDNAGSQFDAKGELNNWWSNQTREVFDKKGECFVEQYNDFCPEYLQGGDNDTRICVNGMRTLGENLADITGLDAAFMAYKMWVKTHGAEKRLPGLREFSPEQLFFISNAYVWCENIPADKWEQEYTYDPHAPGRYRVLGTASNSRFFREVFKCPVGPMNRGKNSCTLW